MGLGYWYFFYLKLWKWCWIYIVVDSEKGSIKVIELMSLVEVGINFIIKMFCLIVMMVLG